MNTEHRWNQDGDIETWRPGGAVKVGRKRIQEVPYVEKLWASSTFTYRHVANDVLNTWT